MIGEQQGIAERCEREWDADASLQSEFRTLEVYTAYRTATALGYARILARAGADTFGSQPGSDSSESLTAKTSHPTAERPADTLDGQPDERFDDLLSMSMDGLHTSAMASYRRIGTLRANSPHLDGDFRIVQVYRERRAASAECRRIQAIERFVTAGGARGFEDVAARMKFDGRSDVDCLTRAIATASRGVG